MNFRRQGLIAFFFLRKSIRHATRCDCNESVVNPRRFSFPSNGNLRIGANSNRTTRRSRASVLALRSASRWCRSSQILCRSRRKTNDRPVLSGKRINPLVKSRIGMPLNLMTVSIAWHRCERLVFITGIKRREKVHSRAMSCEIRNSIKD